MHVMFVLAPTFSLYFLLRSYLEMPSAPEPEPEPEPPKKPNFNLV
jgi:hypothetical protein